MTDLVTGEAVVLELRLAKVASRLLSLIIDLFVQFVLLIVGSLIIGGLASSVDEAAAAAIVAVFLVAVIVGYPAAFETLTRGRTLGKMALGLRVVRDDGGPTRFRHALVRALAAVIEIWLTIGAVALVVSLASSQGKRLGDYLAGTVVIRERVPTAVGGRRDDAAAARLVGQRAGPLPGARRPGAGGAAVPDPVPRARTRHPRVHGCPAGRRSSRLHQPAGAPRGAGLGLPVGGPGGAPPARGRTARRGRGRAASSYAPQWPGAQQPTHGVTRQPAYGSAPQPASWPPAQPPAYGAAQHPPSAAPAQPASAQPPSPPKPPEPAPTMPAPSEPAPSQPPPPEPAPTAAPRPAAPVPDDANPFAPPR